MPEVITTAGKVVGFFVDGQWRAKGHPVEIRSPYDQSVIGQTYEAGETDLEAAITAAVRAFEITRRMPAFQRAHILRTISHEIAKRHEEFAHSISAEAGKPIKTARAETERAVFTFEIAAEEAKRVGGEYLPLDWMASATGRWGMVRRYPAGPIAAITPFNFPLNLVAHKVAPAIAAGCTVVLKPAPQTPLTALLLAEVIAGAGWPAGALNILPMSNEVAARLVSDERFKILSFTGSSAVGWRLKQQAGKKRVLLELGGNAGVIVHSDADLDYAADRCVAAYSYAGQSCISAQRILVERSVFDCFVDRFVARSKKLRLGDPANEHTDIGPLIREDDAKRAEAWVQEAIGAGARVLCGGHRRDSLFEPTVLTNTRPEMRVNCEEVFAPVKTVEPYDTFDEALARINSSRYGLQTGLFTRDARLIFHAYDVLDVGGLVVGDVSTFRVDHMPYGGVKDSGLGREGLRYAIEEMTEPRLLVMNLR